MKKNWILYLLLVISIGCCIYLLFSNKVEDSESNTEEEYKEFVNKIDSLSLQIDTITKERDSLQLVIDSTKSKVVIIEKEYEKEYIDITNQSVLDDIKFFTNYLSKNDGRLFNSNNSSSVKAN